MSQPKEQSEVTGLAGRPLAIFAILMLFIGAYFGVFGTLHVQSTVRPKNAEQQPEVVPIAVKSDGSPILVSPDGSPIRIRPDVNQTSNRVTLTPPPPSPGVTQLVPGPAPKPDAHLAKWAAEEVKILKSEDKTKFEAFRWRNRAANRTEIDDFLAWFAAEFGSLPIRVSPDPLPPSIANKK